MIAIDTNILVYAFDISYNEKREICKEIINEIFEGKKIGVVTNQVLGEFANVVTRKIEKPLSKEDTSSIIGAILTSENWKILNYTGETVLNALKLNKNFWDSVIIQTLKEHNIKEIVTENIRDFEGSGLIVINPFEK